MIKFLLEYAPASMFFVSYYYSNIKTATLYMLITSIICISICYFVNSKISSASLISSGILLVSASVTLITGNPIFIKIKPTIIYIIFGFIVFITTIRDKPVVKYLCKHMCQLKEQSWNILSYRCTGFFLFMALLNEIVWRNCIEWTWIRFKLFGTLSLTLVFIILQIPFVLKNKLADSRLTDKISK